MQLDFPGIYRIDGPNGCVYIGSASSIYFRWKHHTGYLRKGQHKNEHLQRAWNKYGENAFTFSVVEPVEDKSKLLHYEQIWLDILFTSLEPAQIYNKCKVAGTRAGIPHTQERKDRIRAALIGKPHSAERIENIKKNRPKDITPHTKTYDIILQAPSGEIYGPITNLAKFCRTHSLEYSSMLELVKYKKDRYKNWTIQKNTSQ